MKNTFVRFTTGALACAAILAGAATDAGAKAAWESHAGGERYDAARGGMVQTPDGGFASVGESQSFGNGDYDVYVVKVDICGRFQWAATYDFGGDDHGRRIRLDPDGGFIITGETENARHCCTSNDAFLLKLNADGRVEWAKTYGGKGIDRGNDVQLYFKGEKGYIFCGSTTSFGAGEQDAWITATDRFGNVIWSRTYGGPANDEFNGLVQTDVGDIAATGTTTSFKADPLTTDLYIVRTSADGTPQWAKRYGGDADDVGSAIIEAPGIETKIPDLVVAGHSKSVSPKAEAYLLRVNSAGVYLVDHVYGAGNGEGGDAFRDLVLAPDTQEGDIYALGRIYKPSSGFGDFDVFAVRVNAKLNLIWARNHGSEGTDEGYGIAADFQQGGHGFAGFSTIFTYGKEDMYLGLAFPWGDDYCHDGEPKLAETEPGFKDIRTRVATSHVWVECDAKVEGNYNEWYEIICSTCPFGRNIEGGNGDEDLSLRVPLRSPNQSAALRSYVSGADKGTTPTEH